MGRKIETNLIDNWLKDFPPQQVSGDDQFAAEKTHGRIIRVLYVETGKVEHLICLPETKHGQGRTMSGSQKPEKPAMQAHRPGRLTVIDFTHVSQLVGLAKVMHKVSQAWRVQVGGMVGEQRPDELPEP